MNSKTEPRRQRSLMNKAGDLVPAKRGRPRLERRKKDHPLYLTWQHMHERCNNPNHDSYRHYGGRGIHVCERWSGRDGFWRFVADMGDRPEGLTLDRHNNDGDYSPDNCRWATASEQRRNSRPRHRMSKAQAREKSREQQAERRRAQRRARQPSRGWPTALDESDPEGIADFLLGLGYDHEKVVNTLRDRCSLDRITARRIVIGVAQQQGGQQ